MSRGALWLVAASLFLAGCADAAPTRPAATSAPAPEVGRIDGVAYDTEFNPLPRVRVSLAGHPITVYSDRRGAFSLVDVEPGPRELEAHLEGYRPSKLGVDVAAGETLTVRLELEAIPKAVSYQELVLYAGHMTLGFATPLYAVRPGLGVQDELVFPRNLSVGAHAALLEMTWQASSPAGSDRFQLDASIDGLLYNQSVGPSPLVNRVEPLKPAVDVMLTQSIWLPRTCDYYTTATCVADPPDTLIGIAIDQRFDLYSTVFYGSRRPQEYTAVPP